ncbi:hypothetical protein, partial [Streptomyces lonarensis]|uniref:hypothetical protein n=1 Tax=Streptomyces lonarensis TaxID=700599 RepID=UPI0030C66E6C
FYDREWPTLRADADGNLLSYRRDTEDKAHSPEAKLHDAGIHTKNLWNRGKNAEFNDGVKLSAIDLHNAARNNPDFTPGDIKDIVAFAKTYQETKDGLAATGDWETLQQHNTARDQHLATSQRFDRQVRRYYPHITGFIDYSTEGGTTRHIDGEARDGKEPARTNNQFTDRADQLRNNILAGPHIIPGLAARGVLEILRIEQQGGHQTLVDQLKNMTGDQLVDTLMKDFIRPQVMIPDTVPITHDNIQYPPTTNTTTSTTALAAPGPHNNDSLKDLLADAAGPDITSYAYYSELIQTLGDVKSAFEPHQYNLEAITRQILGMKADAPVGMADIIEALEWSGQAHMHNEAGTVADIASYVLDQKTQPNTPQDPADVPPQPDPEAVAQQHIDQYVPALSAWAQEPSSAAAYTRLSGWGNIWAGALAYGYPAGRALIAQMSQDNVRDMDNEIGQPEAWHQDVRARLEQALSNRVLHHYTTADRVETMLPQGLPHEMKSKAQLMWETAGTAANNTPPFDQIEFANDAFVFFFLADPDAPFRDSRFGQGGGGPARIALPQSRLTDSGWLMLTDFHDREWPTLRADDEGNLLSYRRDAPGKDNSPEARMKSARYFIGDIWNDGGRADLDQRAGAASSDLARALANDPAALDTATVERIVSFAEVNKEIREKLRADNEWDALQQHSADREKHLNSSLRFDQQVRRYWPQMIYSAASNWSYPMRGGTTRHIDGEARDGKEPARANNQFTDRADQLHNNVLAGPHIVPGLATRALLEIVRIERQGGNQALVDRLKNMTGDQLVDTLMKDFIRPQVMVPGPVPITRDNVQRPPTSTTALAAPGPHTSDTFKDLLADAAGPDITSYAYYGELIQTLGDVKSAFEP